MSHDKRNVKGGSLKMNNRIILGVVIVGIILVGGYLFQSEGAVVTAQGTSVIDVEPDEVSVLLNVEVRNESAQKAKDELTKISDDVLIQMLRAGLERKDVEFFSFSIYPEYEYVNGGRTQKGFVARQQVNVKSDDFDIVPEIVDNAVEAGALVSYINFQLSDEKQSEFKVEALEKAGEDAKKKAEATASGLGKKLGGLVSVQSQDFNYAPYRYFEASAAGDSIESAKQAALIISPRDVEVRATINVKYKLRSF